MGGATPRNGVGCSAEPTWVHAGVLPSALPILGPTTATGRGYAISWEALKQEYDSRLGFPSSRLSAALVDHFGEVHRVVALRGSIGWPAFFRMLGFEEPSP